jgi:hypothetical protein
MKSFSGQDAGTPVAACSPPGGKWDQECVRKIFCASDPGVVADLAGVELLISDDLVKEIWVYDGKKWELKSDSIKGGQGGSGGKTTIAMNSCQNCDSAAVFLYHEMQHAKQKPGMTVMDREFEAYKKTEEWGLKQKGGKLTQGFRKTVGGVEVVDEDAIKRHVEKNYAVPKGGDPEVIDHKTETSYLVFTEDYSLVEDPQTHATTWRKSKAGDKHAKGANSSADHPVDATKWTCP